MTALADQMAHAAARTVADRQRLDGHTRCLDLIDRLRKSA